MDPSLNFLFFLFIGDEDQPLKTLAEKLSALQARDDVPADIYLGELRRNTKSVAMHSSVCCFALKEVLDLKPFVNSSFLGTVITLMVAGRKPFYERM